MFVVRGISLQNPSCAEFSFKLESTDLEKVTVKSLDEIKREKRLKKESPLATSADEAQIHDAVKDVAPACSSGNHPGKTRLRHLKDLKSQ